MRTSSLLQPQARADTSQGIVSITQQLLPRLQSRHGRGTGSHAYLQLWAPPHLVLLPDVQTHNYCALYATPQLLEGERNACKCSPGAGTSPCSEALPAALPSSASPSGKEQGKGGNCGRRWLEVQGKPVLKELDVSLAKK